jgi:hypothetical protein
VLIHRGGSSGLSSRPWVTALTISHAATVSSTGHRRAIAVTAAPTAATASANSHPAGAACPGSASTSTASVVNNRRSPSALPAKRRSHPRTVPAGRPSRKAMRRCPSPAAFSANHVEAALAQQAGQRGAVGSGAFHADALDVAGGHQPGHQAAITGRCGRELSVAQMPTDGVDHGGVVGVAVGVHAGCDGLLRT